MFPPPLYLPSPQQGFGIIIVNQAWKNCKTQTLSEKEYLGKPKVRRGDKSKDTKGIQILWRLQLQQTQRQLEPDLKPYLLQSLISETTCPAFNNDNNITSHVKGKKKQSEEKK